MEKLRLQMRRVSWKAGKLRLPVQRVSWKPGRLRLPVRRRSLPAEESRLLLPDHRLRLDGMRFHRISRFLMRGKHSWKPVRVN